MRAFKKLMAGAIATAIAATMATSAFAADFADGKVSFVKTKDAEGNVTAYDYNAVGQTTVLVVPAAEWESETPLADLADTDILYINQYEDAGEANAAIIAGFGVKLNDKGTLEDGDYYALFGGTKDGSFAITPVAFSVTTTPEGPVLKFADVNQDGEIGTADATALLCHLANIEYLTFATDADYKAVCDMNKDGEVGTADATALLCHLANIEYIPDLLN